MLNYWSRIQVHISTFSSISIIQLYFGFKSRVYLIIGHWYFVPAWNCHAGREWLVRKVSKRISLSNVGYYGMEWNKLHLLVSSQLQLTLGDQEILLFRPFNPRCPPKSPIIVRPITSISFGVVSFDEWVTYWYLPSSEFPSRGQLWGQSLPKLMLQLTNENEIQVQGKNWNC